jgi:dihydroflavonol-4-reductase
MERALVIGATGFVGNHILQALVHSDIDVEAMRRWNSDTSPIQKLGVKSVVGDLLDEESLIETLAGFNFVFMAAAPRLAGDDRSHKSRSSKDGWTYLQRSVVGMRNLLKVAREVDVERVVVTSCATTIAAPTKGALSTESDVYLPGTAGSNIVEAQYAAEQECFRQAADGMDIVILNPGICIGEGVVLPSQKLLSKTSKKARLNVVDVDDAARAHVRAARRQSNGERFVLGGENTTVEELYARFEPADATVARLGRYDVRLSDDEDQLRHLSLFRSGTWLDSTRAEREFGFRPRSL